MAQALLLGKPFHGKTREVEGRPEKLVITSESEEQKKTLTGYGGVSVGRKLETKVTYHLLRLNWGPENALVYARKNYEPQQEDEELVLDLFGSVG